MVRIIFFLFPVMLSTFPGYSQILEFNDLARLSLVINTDAEESMPLLNPDQTKLFFVRSFYNNNIGGKYGGQDIWYSERTSTGWQSPSNKFAALNDKDNNALIGIDKHGQTLYMLNSSPAGKVSGIYFSHLKNNNWTKPEFIPVRGIDNKDFVGMYVAPDYDVILLTMRGNDSYGEEDIYVSLKNSSGVWSKPKNIGTTINTSGFEVSPFLSTDKKRLYFASNGHVGFGDADIYYSDRLYDSWETWSAPVNLGGLVNSKKFDAYFSIYGDSVAYFASNRDSELADIYRVKVSAKTSYLESGEKYLSQKEWNSTVGENVNQKIVYARNAKNLTASQKELLYYISNRISGKKDVKIQINVKEEEDADLSKFRLREIYGELRLGGIESDRIREEYHEEIVKRSEGGVIEIRLFRDETNN